MALLFFLSIAPFIFFLLLLLLKKTSLLFASLATLSLTLVLSLIVWRILPSFVYLSFIKGFFVAFDIFIIIFGAIFFLEILKSGKVIDSISYYLESISKDYRVKVIILAWFFENFLEGTAGFGTAGVIIAPILVSLGLSPITAVVISLLGNSTSVAFGAAGTPIRVGFADLSTPLLPIYTALINCVGLIVPIFILSTLVFNQKNKKEQFKEALPFAIWSGVAFVLPSLLTVFLGQEFPSILGSVIGLLLVIFTTKIGIFLPKNIRTIDGSKPKDGQSLLKDIFPYFLLVILLVIGKYFLPSIKINVFGVTHSFNLFNPGFIFVLSGLPFAFFWKKGGNIPSLIKSSFSKSVNPFLVILLMSTMVQLMTNSGQNLSFIPSSLGLIAKSFENFLMPLLAPFVGAFGSFLTGSATVSNIMFGNFFKAASEVLRFDTSKILALELVGASAGNMIALSDMLGAEAVVGLHNKERSILKKVVLPCLIYLLLVGLLGMIFVSASH